MDFCMYVDKIIKVDISNGYYYLGKVVETDDKFLSLIDKNNKLITVAIRDILNIREVGNG